MKKLAVILLCLHLLLSNTSCGQSTTNQKPAELDNKIQFNGKLYKLKEQVDISNVQLNKHQEAKIIFHEINDPKRNMVMGYLPLPNNWKIKEHIGNDNIIATGPNNIKVYGEKVENFVFSQLSGFNQMMANMGHQIKPLRSVEQLIKEEFVPLFSNDGLKLLKLYPLPKQKAYDENYEQFVFKPVPMQKTFNVMATEWEDSLGNMTLFVLRQYIIYTQEGCYWGYKASGLEAPKSQFETAKNNYLYTLANSKYSPQWLKTIYLEDAQNSARMGKLHEDRMRGLIAEGEAIVQRGKEHSAMVDRNHKQFMDAQLERQTVSTGSTNYEVDAGSKVYWINANGEYIPTDNVNFDPNLDPNLNNETWTKGTINN